MIGDRTDRRSWRPQAFGRRPAREIEAPLIEPLWGGERILVHVSETGLDLRDAEGQPMDRPALAAAILVAIQADSAILDGYLAPEAAQSGVGLWSGAEVRVPTAGETTRQMLLGGRSRRAELVEALEARAERRVEADEPVAFVAVDLLLLDGEDLLDVPLLERKRLLDAVVLESELVRIGIHVRPPVEPWLGTWRNLGFRKLAYKDPNGRYRPGEPNDGWASASIPRS